MNSRKSSAVVPILFVTMVLSCVTVAAQEAPTVTADGKNIYLVKPGDTLAEIAVKLYGDPQKWKDIWKNNPQISKPELIFPGDTLILGEAPTTPGYGSAAEKKAGETAASATGVQAAEAGAGAGEPGAESSGERAVSAAEREIEAMREAPEDVVLLQPVSAAEAPAMSANVFENCGYIANELPEGSIVGSVYGKEAMSTFDTVFINRGDKHGLTIGQEFRILRPIKEVFHPRTGVSMGWLIRIVGRLTTDCLRAETATATITKVYDVIKIGDRLEPYSPVTVPSEHYLSPKLAGPCLPPGRGVEATMLASREDKRALAEGDIVYIDRGLASGIVPGTKLVAYRHGPTRQGEEPYMVGELQILLSQNYTATAMVTNSLTPLKLGDALLVW